MNVFSPMGDTFRDENDLISSFIRGNDSEKEKYFDKCQKEYVSDIYEY